MRCESCGKEIPKERLRILPNTHRCVNCSDEKKKLGFFVYDNAKGTAPRLVVSNDNDSIEPTRSSVRIKHSKKQSTAEWINLEEWDDFNLSM